MEKEKPIKVEAEITTTKNVSSGIGKGFGIVIGIFLALIVIAVSCGILISSNAKKIQDKSNEITANAIQESYRAGVETQQQDRTQIQNTIDNSLPVNEKSKEKATNWIPSTVIAQNTQNGVTLMIHSVKAIKKGTDWGKVTNLQFTIKNDNTKTIYSPVLLLFLYNENNSYVRDIEQKAQVRDSVELDSYLQNGDILSKEVSINAAYSGDMNKSITLKIILANGLYSPESIVSVEFNVDFE